MELADKEHGFYFLSMHASLRATTPATYVARLRQK